MNTSVEKSGLAVLPGLSRAYPRPREEVPPLVIGARVHEALWCWMPTLSMTLACLISYVDRVTLAILAPTILRKARLSAEQYGFIISAFAIAYTAGCPIWGRTLDRFGLRRVMAAAVALWTAASASHALASGFLGFAVARFLLGFAEGATSPGSLRTVVQTLAPSRRSRGLALALSGGSVGALLTPILLTPIAARWGWRAAFCFTGLVGCLWLWLLQGHIPALAPALPSTPPEGRQDRRTGLRWTDPRLWSFLCIGPMGTLPISFVLYGTPLYLGRCLGASQAEIGCVLWIPPLRWELGFLFWGWVMDRITVGGGSFPAVRRWFAVLAVLSLPLALAPWFGSSRAVLVVLFLAMFVAGGFTIFNLAYGTKTFPLASSGLMAGLSTGTASALVAISMPFFGRLFDQHRYGMAFAVAACTPPVGFVLWWMLNKICDSGRGNPRESRPPSPTASQGRRHRRERGSAR